MALASGTRLGPYEILGPLGSGGMGEVYRARDSKLDREVAVKVLPSHLTSDADALARFDREAKAVASLSHPNILAIHDFGTQGGTAYAVMELLEGETLRGKLDGGPVKQYQAVDWALQIAKGLSAAHGKGVLHRDLKPENVFVSRDGHVKILDFGLAKRVDAPTEQTSAPTGTGHTEPGTVMGTMGYMSPEQLRGLPVDHRSDIFSFGAILYEMLSGHKAFKRDTSSDTIAAILKEDPPELTQSGRNISPAMDHIVRHCLEKDRENRFQTAKDVAFALSEASSTTTTFTSGVQAVVVPEKKSRRNALIAAAVVAVLAAAGLLLWKRPRPDAAAGGAKRVAVLPFENLGSPEDDYFADGIADEVRGKLTSLPGIEVIARGSSTPYKKTNKTPQEIARELDARYLLTATVRWQKGGGASRVQVRPELVEIKASGAPASRWQQSFDASLTDVFQVQSDIASRVAESLGVALAEGQRQQLSGRPTQNLAAYDAYLKGEETSAAGTRSEPAIVRRALSFYEQAVALDPAFAVAWGRVSASLALLYSNSVPSPEVAERARRAAEKCVALAPEQADGYRALATYYRLVAGDPARALPEFEKALRFSPGQPNLIRGLALTEIGLGKWNEALEHLRQALRLDPRSPSIVLGDLFLRLHRSREAREEFERVLRLVPTNLGVIQGIATAHLTEGDLPGARAALARAGKAVEQDALVAFVSLYNDLVWLLDPGQTEILRRLTPPAFDDNSAAWAIVQAQARRFAGDASGAREYAEQARQAVEEQLRSTPDDPSLHALRGLALAYLGRKDEALREGERGLALGGPARNADSGTYILHQLVRIEIEVGEHEKALAHLEQLLKIPYFLTPAWLKIDPNFDPLRQNPRFQKLVVDGK